MFDNYEEYWENFLDKNPGWFPGNIHEMRKQCYEAGVKQGKLARQVDVDAKQAQIDELMLEYCPNEMTQSQIDEWAKHQVAVEVDIELDDDPLL